VKEGERSGIYASIIAVIVTVIYLVNVRKRGGFNAGFANKQKRYTGQVIDPPHDLSSGLVGIVEHGYVGMRDMRAIVAEMAVDGYVDVDVTGEATAFQKTDLAPKQSRDDMVALYDGMFDRVDRVPIDKFRRNGQWMAGQQFRAIEDRLVREKLYPPLKETLKRQSIGAAIATVGSATVLSISSWLNVSGFGGFGWLVAPAIVLGLGIIIVVNQFPRRNKYGMTRQEECREFRRYLENLSEEQVRRTLASGLFERYLPSAVAFGCAEHLGEVFDQLVPADATVEQPEWLVARQDEVFTHSQIARIFADVSN